MEGNKHPAIKDLKRIRCLSQFSDEQLAKLDSKLLLEHAVKDECLIELGCNESYSFYLIAGNLEATTHDGNQVRFESSDEGELFPIAQLRRRTIRAAARPAVQLPAAVNVNASSWDELPASAAIIVQSPLPLFRSRWERQKP